MSEERIFLTFDQAVEMLPDGDSIHTFMCGGPVLLGADWDRKRVVEVLRNGKPELSGEMATNMRHGIAATREDGETIFIATKEPS